MPESPSSARCWREDHIAAGLFFTPGVPNQLIFPLPHVRVLSGYLLGYLQGVLPHSEVGSREKPLCAILSTPS